MQPQKMTLAHYAAANSDPIMLAMLIKVKFVMTTVSLVGG